MFYLTSCLLVCTLNIRDTNLPEFVYTVTIYFSKFTLDTELRCNREGVRRLFLPYIFVVLLLVTICYDFAIFPPRVVLFRSVRAKVCNVVPRCVSSKTVTLSALCEI